VGQCGTWAQFVASQYNHSTVLSGIVALEVYYHPLLGRANKTGHAMMGAKHHREALQEQRPCAMPALGCAHSSTCPMLSGK